MIVTLCKKIQNEKECTIVRVRSDHGTEFKNSKVETYCDEIGISHEFSAVGTPQQNGIVERKNRTLQEMARCMLEGKGLPKRFWAEAVNTACHIANRVYLRPHTKRTPYELWNNKKPTLKYFRVFESKCYILRDRENLGKFDSRSDDGIFLGYSPNSRAYRVYNLVSHKIMESINVVIDDDASCPQGILEEDESPLEVSQKKTEEETYPPLVREKGVPTSVVKNHPTTTVLGDIESGVRTRNQLLNELNFQCFTSQIEPKNVKEALQDEFWLLAMQEELNQFQRLDVWELVPRPRNQNIVGTK